MPVQITINGADAAESIQELSVLAAAISGQKVSTFEAVPVQEEKPKRQRTAKAEAAKKQEEPEKPDVTEEEGIDGEEGIPTVEELREVAAAKGKTAEGKKAVKALLDEFGSKNITAVPEEQRAAFLARLKAL
ncbi:hypothetical protein WJ0W_006389 [Paenibacillus melissococcoides]|uniref:Uncharacterized protein n=1 Tax=Paenibacillus melissococcoides TaxID=2912268 RepID=A0ABM9G0Y3_9BACL|nr:MULTISPECIES: hypothetical protein [Paenibacillus]CAH8245112.1 hypothetical protein WJ0W_002342 [Paenibacillus melissococcoides]CAH8249203.1 hypothetical protein WJ0W_006389 [Paenibacillus melissococcoides]CAH8709940.1 hypothetical protein WDD9_002422 [Paenibacillus melissococcoides]CAH8710667.1 hypothetical protein HTL2_002709 [Paenibacillus melissococcoides]GIO81188.1 hypothetical protein J6TS7_47980 [Paenibacillus dendritiformis]